MYSVDEDFKDDYCISCAEKRPTAKLPPNKSLQKSIQNWLSKLTKEERQLIFTNTCPEFSQLLLEILQKLNERSDKCLVYVTWTPGSPPYHIHANPLYYEDSYYYPSKTNGKSVSVDPLKVKQCENEIYANIRLFTNKTFLDSITVAHRLLDDSKMLFECLEIFSNGHSFCASQSTAEYKALFKGGKRNIRSKQQSKEDQIEQYTKLFPQWFNPNKGGTVFQWICAFLEQTVLIRYHELRGSKPLSMEELVGEYRQILASHKKLEEYWKSLPQRGKVKMLSDFEKAAKAVAPMEKLAFFKTVSISCQVLQKSSSAEALSAKEFLCYACYYANPYQLLDTLTFTKIPLARRMISQLGEKLLETIKEYYRDYLAAQLVKEEEEEAKRKLAKSSKNKQQEIPSPVKDVQITYDEDEVENYLSHDWEKMRDMEYYKYFFQHIDLNNVLTLSMESVFDKKKKGKKKKKKKSKEINAAATESPIEPVNVREVFGDDEEEEVKTQPEIEEKVEQKIIEPVKPNKVETKVEKEETKNIEKVVKKEIRPYPPQKIEPAPPVKPVHKPNKEKKKPNTAFLQNAKAEYEELKKSALKLFSEKTGVTPVAPKPKKPSKKKKKNKKSVVTETSPAPEKPPSEINCESTINSVELSTRKGSTASCNNCATSGQGSKMKSNSPYRWRKHSGDWRESGGRQIHYRRKGDYSKEIATQTMCPYMGWDEPVTGYGCEVPQIAPQPVFIYVPFYLDQKQAGIMDALNVEIQTAIAKIDNYNATLKPICELIQHKIEGVARAVFAPEQVRTALYGSMAAGLALPYSDIDVAILGVDMEGGLEKLGETLAQQEYVNECKVIATARVPVIKLVLSLAKLGVKAEMMEIKVDVTIGKLSEEKAGTSSVRNGVKFVEWIQERLKEVPALKPVVLLIKMLLANNDLNIPYHGILMCQ